MRWARTVGILVAIGLPLISSWQVGYATAQERLPWQQGDGAEVAIAGMPVTALSAPVLLRLKAVRRIEVLAEVANEAGGHGGQAAERVALRGSGTLRRSKAIDGGYDLDLRFNELTASEGSRRVKGALAGFSATLDPLGNAYLSRADYTGFVTGDAAALNGTDAHAAARGLIDMLQSGLASLPESPVTAGQPLFDISDHLRFQSVAEGLVELPVGPVVGRAIGSAFYSGRLCVAARLASDVTVAFPDGQADVAVSGAQLIDVGTGLPLYTELRVRGEVGGARGIPVAFTTRIALALSGMPEPRLPEALATAAPAEPVRAAPTPEPSYGYDPAQRLRTLQQLHEQGLITDQEYRAKRAEILDSL